MLQIWRHCCKAIARWSKANGTVIVTVIKASIEGSGLDCVCPFSPYYYLVGVVYLQASLRNNGKYKAMYIMAQINEKIDETLHNAIVDALVCFHSNWQFGFDAT